MPNVSAERRPAAVLADGLASGVGATGVMSGLMLGWQRLAGGGRLGPGMISDRVLAAGGAEPRGRMPRRVTETLAHFAFGGGAGAVYAGLTQALTRAAPASARIPAPLRGVVFAAALWGMTYGSGIPLLGLLPWPDRDRSGRQLRIVAAHLVYGTALGRSAG